MSSECNVPFYCSIFLVQYDAEKLKLLSFVAPLKKSKAGEHRANACNMVRGNWVARNSTSVILPVHTYILQKNVWFLCPL